MPRRAAGGNDTFTLAATLTASDSLDGGSGSDTLTLNGDYSAGLTFGAATVVNIELLQLAAGHSYNFTTNDGNVASGATMAVDGSALGAGDVLTFNGTAETGRLLSIAGGAGQRRAERRRAGRHVRPEPRRATTPCTAMAATIPSRSEPR